MADAKTKVMDEFREFAVRGNMVDMAVGIIIGGAFGKIVTSFVNDVLMPPIGLLLGRVDFSNLYVSLSGRRYDSLAAAKLDGAATLNYGLFLNNVLDFMIVAAVVFLMVRQLNRLRSRPKAADLPTTRPCPYCLTAIPMGASRCSACTAEVQPQAG